MVAQTFYAIPEEAGTLKIIGTFQFQSFVQAVTSQALRIPQSKITVITRRLGGAYGCKITRGAGLAAAVALAATKLRRPVKMKMLMEYQNDMVGKRNFFRVDYKVGLGWKDGWRQAHMLGSCCADWRHERRPSDCRPSQGVLARRRVL